MFRRIYGAWLIIHALAPLIVLVLVTLASVTAAGRISRAAGAYRAAIDSEVATARQAIARANEGFTALGSYVNQVNRAVDGIAASVRALVPSISIKIPDLGGLHFPEIGPIAIPGAREFKQAVAKVEAAGRAVKNDIDKVTSLVTVPAQLTRVNAATGRFTGELWSAAMGWIWVVLGIVLFSATVWLLGAVVRIATQVRRGWSLLFAAA